MPEQELPEAGNKPGEPSGAAGDNSSVEPAAHADHDSAGAGSVVQRSRPALSAIQPPGEEPPTFEADPDDWDIQYPAPGLRPTPRQEYVCPRLDLREGRLPRRAEPGIPDLPIDELIGELYEYVEGLEPLHSSESVEGESVEGGAGEPSKGKPAEMVAVEFYRSHKRDYLPPVEVASLAQRRGEPFTGPRFKSYSGVPTEEPLESSIRYALDSIQCVLAEDWNFPEIELAALNRPAHLLAGRADPFMELSEALTELEDELYLLHPGISRQALIDFFRSFEVHKHLKLRAIRMLRFYTKVPPGEPAQEPAGERRVWAALGQVRTKLEAYVEDLVRKATAPARKLSPDGLILEYCKKKGLSQRGLAAEAEIAPGTLARIMSRRKVHASNAKKLADYLDRHDCPCKVKDLLPS